MQQTKSYWRLVALAGVVSAFIASACVVTTTTDDDDDNTAGKGSGGAGTAGAGTAGKAGAGTAGASTAGTAGASPAGGAGPVSFQCDPGEGGAVGTPNSCAPIDTNDKCQKCTQAKCCGEYEACYAYNPGNQCGWGGPLTVNGEPNEGGEALCIQACLQKVVADKQTAPEDSDYQTCANNCATTPSNGASKDCGTIIGLQTNALIECLRRDCSEDCFGA